jgi:hypothetical protein
MKIIFILLSFKLKKNSIVVRKVGLRFVRFQVVCLDLMVIIRHLSLNLSKLLFTCMGRGVSHQMINVLIVMVKHASLIHVIHKLKEK